MKRLIPGLFAVGLMSIPLQAKAHVVNDYYGGIRARATVRSALYASPLAWRHAGAARHAARAHLGARSFTAMTSWYGGGPRWMEPNTHTANGERFNRWGLTAAHRTLKFGTLLNVCYVRCAIVRINDRGPAAWTGNALDLSRGAATAIGLIGAGTGFVQVAQVN